jgi:hypothetical protein
MVSSLTSPPPFSSHGFCSFPALGVSAFGFLSSIALSLFCKKSENINALLSYSCALFKQERSANSFPANDFRALLQITGGAPQCAEIPTHSIQCPTANPFGIRTSKTQHLKSFGIRTYGKTRGGVGWGCSLLSHIALSFTFVPLVVS